MGKKVESIVILGGGTAGWMTAAYLNRALSPETRITLVESRDVPTVGVGEATIPTLRTTLEFLGLEEDVWMPQCSATYKTAIRFNGWMSADRPLEGFYHPFGDRPDPQLSPYEKPYFPVVDQGFAMYHQWLKRRLEGRTNLPMTYECHPTAALCDAMKAPRRVDSPAHEIRSAYHIDAGLLADVLRKTAKARGVQHVIDTVVDVELDERGFVECLALESGRRLNGELFFDCSGFRGRIINEALGERFLSDHASLKCNAAVAIQANDDPKDGSLRPYTTSTAIGHGWVWDVPLMNRSGCGYVYSDECISEDQAETELRAFLGERAEGKPARHLKMRIGRNPAPWVKNCIAIGLSSCFLEPLESTGIFLTEYQLGALLPVFPTVDMEPPLRRKYNAMVEDVYLELRDFIVMHYVASPRRDTSFWKLVANETEVPESLQQKLDLFDVCLPVLDGLKFTVFKGQSYACILDGMGRIPKNPYPILEHVALGDSAIEKVRMRTKHLLSTLPDHHACMAEMGRRSRS